LARKLAVLVVHPQVVDEGLDRAEVLAADLAVGPVGLEVLLALCSRGEGQLAQAARVHLLAILVGSFVLLQTPKIFKPVGRDSRKNHSFIPIDLTGYFHTIRFYGLDVK
jgi:hypothetical protein